MPLNSDYLEETPRPEEVLRLGDPTNAATSLTVVAHNGCVQGIHGEVVLASLMTLNISERFDADTLARVPVLATANLTVADAKRLIATLQNLVQEEDAVEWVSIEETPL